MVETKEEAEKYKEEIAKYLEEEKEKKNYSLYLTKEYVEKIKSTLNAPISKIVDDFLGSMTLALKTMEEEKKKKEEKNGGTKK